MQIENDALADNCNVQAKKKKKKIWSLKDQENKKRKEQKRKERCRFEMHHKLA